MNTRTLHPIQNDTGKRNWCGPGAIASLTGKSTAMYKQALSARGHMGITKMEAYLTAEFGDRVRIQASGGPLWRALPLHKRGVVMVRGHFLAFDGKLIQDTHCRRPTWVCDSKHRSRRVVKMWVIE